MRGSARRSRLLARHKDRAEYVTPMVDEQRQAPAELMTRLRQLVDMRVAQGNHLEHAGKLAPTTTTDCGSSRRSR